MNGVQLDRGMTGKREARRTELRTKLLASARHQIVEGGTTALRARDLARDAGCALGAIYNVFDDLEDLAFHVRAEIFRDMVFWITSELDRAAASEPLDRLVLMAEKYCQFAQENRNAWLAIFNTALPSDQVPDWYLEALKQLMGHIITPLQQLAPKAPDGEAVLTARILFSSVHGVIVLHIQQRPSGIETTSLGTAFERIVRAQVADFAVRVGQ